MNNGWQIRKRLQNHWALPAEERALFYKAAVHSALVRFVTLYLPMKWWYKPWLGNPVSAGDCKRDTYRLNETTEKKIRRAVSRAKRVVPWKTTCLVEAIVKRKLYRNNGMEQYIHILVQQKNGELHAHAYVENLAGNHQNKAVGQSNFAFC